MTQLFNNFKSVVERINLASNSRTNNLIPVRLVAVSKLKSIDDIIEIYNTGQRHFGENYVKELEEKSKSEEILKNCPQIKWHFIGNLQSNKVNKIVSIPNLYVIETVDSNSLADKLQKALLAQNKPDPLKIMIQVNTSSEDQKNGIELNKVNETYSHIINECKNLEVTGLMTIGSVNESLNSQGLNQDFINLIDSQKSLIKEFNLDENKLELSMGMSQDFEKAIQMGSTSVRVGSLIFGERDKK